MTLRLTTRQREVLETLRALTELRGFPPALRELGKALGIGSTNAVADHLRALERKGYIERQVAIARSTTITTKGIAELAEVST